MHEASPFRAALIVPVILIYAAAFGAYQAVDWALALKVLPSAEAAGKDMGIWRISMVNAYGANR